MNNQNAGGQNHPVHYNPAQPVTPPQQVYQQPVRPQPVQSVPQPVRPVYQQPAVQQILQVQQIPEYNIQAKSAIASMNKALFVLLSVLFGWICSRSLLSGHVGLGMSVMGLSFFLIYIPFILTRQKKNVPLSGWLLFIPQIILLAGDLLDTEISNCTTGKPFSFELICDTCISFLAMPFMNMGTTVMGIFFGKDKSKKKDKNALKIAIGAAISLPVVFILITMFAFADEMFARWVNNILTMLNLNFFRILTDILLTIIVMLYVMPLVVSLRSGYHKPYDHKLSRRLLDPIIVSTVLFASSVVYLVFVAVQFTYLFAVLGSLPDGLTL